MKEGKEFRKKIVDTYSQAAFTRMVLTTLSTEKAVGNKYLSEEDLFRKLCLRCNVKAGQALDDLVKLGFLEKASVVISKKETIAAYALTEAGGWKLHVILTLSNDGKEGK
jgi:hypothetical protein